MPEITVQPYASGYLMPPIDYATVGAAMHPGIFSCAPEASLAEVASIMTMHRVHCVAVMAMTQDGSGERRVWGIISDLDLLRAGIRGGAGVTASELAQEPVICVRDTTPLRDAGETMAAHRVSHLATCQRPVREDVGHAELGGDVEQLRRQVAVDQLREGRFAAGRHR